ncbi:MAG: hydroxyacylglutathione hydrolase [bacterium]|nr:hydroxyacylglutathione hydrolase [bacterium]
MRIHQIYTGSNLRNFTYVIHSEDGERVYCIDPYDAGQVADFLDARGLRLTHIINTHEHHDHINGNPGLLERYGETAVRVCAHEAICGMIPGFDQGVAAGDRLPIEEGAYFEALDTPGHSRAHVCLLLRDRQSEERAPQDARQAPAAVFTGDILFNAGVGRCNIGGTPEALFETIRDQFQILADSVKVYPGHEYMGNNLRFTLEYEPENQAARRLLNEYETAIAAGRYIVSDLGLERAMNTFLRLDSPDLRRELGRRFARLDARGASERDIFLQLRRLRDDW